MNMALIQGVLSSEPRQKTLPSGSLLVTWEVTTETGGTKATVPVVWFDPPASLRDLASATEVVVLGSVRRRFFRAEGRTVSSTEVVALRGARASRTRQVTALREAALGNVHDLGQLA